MPIDISKVDVIANRRKFSAVRISLAGIAVAGIALAVFHMVTATRDLDPAELRVGVLPDQSPELLLQRYNPLIDYLSAQTGAEMKLIIPADYSDAVRLFSEGRIDLAYFGGLTFVQAQSSYGATPLVMREIDTRFTSWFLAKPELAGFQLSDLKDRSLSFGSKFSTSGHLMPRHFLQRQWKIDPEAFFSEVNYSGAHDKTAELVRDGKVELGVANSAIVKKMIEEGRLAADEIHVLWQTPPYPDYVWVVQGSLSETLKTRLRDAFLGLDAANPGDDEILSALNAKTFLPANPEDFKTLSNIAVNLELIEPQVK